MKRQRRRQRSAEEIERLVGGFRESGQSRADFAAAKGLSVAMLDYYRRRAATGASKLVEIQLDTSGISIPPREDGLAVVLRNGRRLEMAWRALETMADGRTLRRVAGWLEQV